MSIGEHVVKDYATTSLSLKAHPVSFVREKLRLLHILSSQELKTAKDGDPVKVAGLVLVRQRPGTASGICFITIEDETGCINLVVFENLFIEYRRQILQSQLLIVEGKLQIEGEVIHVIVNACYDFSRLLGSLTALRNEKSHSLALPDGNESISKEVTSPSNVRENPQEKLFPEARNFR